MVSSREKFWHKTFWLNNLKGEICVGALLLAFKFSLEQNPFHGKKFCYQDTKLRIYYYDTMITHNPL